MRVCGLRVGVAEGKRRLVRFCVLGLVGYVRFCFGD